MSKRDAKPRTLTGKLIAKIALEMNAEVVVEPRWGAVGQITFPNGIRRYFRSSTIDINTIGASDIAKDKDYAAFFLRAMGYPTPEGQAFFADMWAETIGSKRTLGQALAYAKRLGYPVIIKPNSSSQGRGVALVHNDREATRGLRAIFAYDHVALVQRPLEGRDYRLVVLDGEIISAYQRLPLTVTGDGRSSITTLLKKKIHAYKKAGRSISIRPDEQRIQGVLKHAHLKPRSVLPKGKTIALLHNANLSTGGDAIDVTNHVHPQWRTLAARIANDMGLRLSGIDIIAKGSLTEPPRDYCVLEINAAPGLDHYAHSGPEQTELVEHMYRRILQALSRA